MILCSLSHLNNDFSIFISKSQNIFRARMSAKSGRVNVGRIAEARVVEIVVSVADKSIEEKRVGEFFVFHRKLRMKSVQGNGIEPEAVTWQPRHARRTHFGDYLLQWTNKSLNN